MIQKANIKAWEINQVYRFSAMRGYTIEYGTSQKNHGIKRILFF